MSVRGDTTSDEGGPWKGGGDGPGMESSRARSGAQSGLGTGLGGRDLTRLIEALPPHAPGKSCTILYVVIFLACGLVSKLVRKGQVRLMAQNLDPRRLVE